MLRFSVDDPGGKVEISKAAVKQPNQYSSRKAALRFSVEDPGGQVESATHICTFVTFACLRDRYFHILKISVCA